VALRETGCGASCYSWGVVLYVRGFDTAEERARTEKAVN
jgi:hypothetical protein